MFCRKLKNIQPLASLINISTDAILVKRSSLSYAKISRKFTVKYSTLKIAKSFEVDSMRFETYETKFIYSKALNSNLLLSSTPDAQLIDGKKIAEDIRNELREQIEAWMVKENHRAPQLTAILLGDDPVSELKFLRRLNNHLFRMHFFIGQSNLCQQQNEGMNACTQSVE